MPQAALNLAGFSEDAAENILENRRRFLKLFRGEWSLEAAGKCMAPMSALSEMRPRRSPPKTPAVIRSTVMLSSATPSGSWLELRLLDCVPILIGDPKTSSFAAVHAGWRGTYAGIVLYALERLASEYNAQPGDCRIAIGPAAAACCYEVGSEVIDGFKERFPGADDLFKPTREGHARIRSAQSKSKSVAGGGSRSRTYSYSPSVHDVAD